jgi:hypothetical protein
MKLRRRTARKQRGEKGEKKNRKEEKEERKERKEWREKRKQKQRARMETKGLKSNFTLAVPETVDVENEFITLNSYDYTQTYVLSCMV